MFGIRVLIGQSRLIHTHIACEIDAAKNHRNNLPNFLSFAWFDTLDFNRLPCSNNKMYDDAVFADRFRYQLTLLGDSVLIGPSRLLRAHIAYEIDNAKNTAALF